MIAGLVPESIKTFEKMTPVNSEQVRLELFIDQSLLEKLERPKNLTSHKHQNLRELLHSLVDQELERKDPMLKFQKARDKGRCTYFDSRSKRTCNSKHKLQMEHIEP